MTRTRVWPIGYGAEHGYLVRGAQTETEAREAVYAYVLALWTEAPRLDIAESAVVEARIASDGTYHVHPGWWRWIPTPHDHESRMRMEEAVPGSYGSFQGIMLERPW